MSPIKRAKTIRSDRSQPLTAENLRRHTKRKGKLNTLEVMGLDASKGPGIRRSKRLASSIETGDDSIASTGEKPNTTSQITQKSSFTAAHYRLSILKNANIRFQFRLPPEDIRAQITAIVQTEVSPKRKEELSLIGQRLCNDFADVLAIAAREDDCVELFNQALFSMGYHESLAVRRKADWQPSLKPRIDPKFKPNHLYISVNKAKESLERPSKRQKRGENHISPGPSGATVSAEQIGSPPIPQSEVKTPRPDISIGLRDSAIFNALRSQELTTRKIEQFFESLAMPHPPNGTPLLYSEPTQAILQIRFPFLLVEGKSYATSRTIYEAQNQAAVSGACSVKILHDLDDLVCKTDPGSYSKGQPIVFSVCTEGPIHQLWVHYTTEEDEGDDGYRIYYMALVKTCDIAICNDVLGFLEAIDNVMRWGSCELKETMVKQLKLVWQRGHS